MENAQSKKENIHAKHRERVREKFLKVGLDGFSEHEILEILLFYVFAQQDTNDLAHRLINTFGSLHNVLNADIDALCTVKGIGKRAAVLIRLIGDIVKRDIEKPDERPSLDTTNKMGEYMMRFFGEEAIESVVAVALDSRFRVIRVIKVAEGDFESVRFSSSKLARELVASKAVATVISHNHPSFNAMASSEDLRATRILTENLSKVGITLVDHIIVALDGFVSVSRDRGVTEYRL